MKSFAAFMAATAFLFTACATPPSPEVNAALLHTVDNQEILVRDLRVWEKNYQVESRRFHPRWRQSLERIALNFEDMAAAETVAPDRARVYFRSGGWDEFEDLFVDEYSLRGWTEYGPFEIDASLIHGLVFLDHDLRPVRRDFDRITPVEIPAEYTDRLVTFEGDVISGGILEDEFLIMTPYGRLRLERPQLASIVVDREGDSLRQIVHFANGDVIRGWIEPGFVTMRMESGQEVAMEFDRLSRVLFRRPVAVDAQY